MRIYIYVFQEFPFALLLVSRFVCYCLLLLLVLGIAYLMYPGEPAGSGKKDPPLLVLLPRCGLVQTGNCRGLPFARSRAHLGSRASQLAWLWPCPHANSLDAGVQAGGTRPPLLSRISPSKGYLRGGLSPPAAQPTVRHEGVLLPSNPPLLFLCFHFLLPALSLPLSLCLSLSLRCPASLAALPNAGRRALAP